MRAGTNEVDRIALDLIDQQEITTHMAFPVVGPVAPEGVVQPLGAQRCIVSDQEQHDMLELVHVVKARSRKPLPILPE
jgi:hypothetical protein